MLERLNVLIIGSEGFKLGTHAGPSSRHSSSTSYLSSKEYPPSSKLGRSFRASLHEQSLQDQLPPNTGPAGTVETSCAGLLSTANKNLSHVPCKFFKQGICQAGKSCPFSHDFEGSASADKLPCKYFQKGNCKFGLKCALAHYLPDGTRVNNKSSLSYRRHTDRTERTRSHLNLAGSSIYGSNDSSAYYLKTSPSMAGSTSLGEANGPSSESLYGNTYTGLHERTTSTSSMPIMPLRSSRSNFFVSSNTTSQLQDAFGSGDWQSRPSFNFSSNLFSSGNNNYALVNGLNQSPSDLSRNSLYNGEPRKPASAVSLPSFNMAFPGNNASSPSSPVYVFNQFVSEDALVTDEADGAEEEPFFEDYVPASLGNLILTPQEKQRRDSRSQSGTLLVRPNVSKASDGSVDKTWAQLLAIKDNESVFLMD